MILLVTNRRDFTTDYVIQELERRNLAYVRLNTDALGGALVSLDPAHAAADQLELEGQTLLLDSVRSAYFRRPEPPVAANNVADQRDRDYCLAEWLALLRTVIGRIEGRWFNEPAAIVAAEDKPRQLIAARAVGFAVPDTLVSNDPNAVRAFLGGRRAVAKPLRQGLLDPDGAGSVMFTTAVPASLDAPDDAFRAAPVIYQAEIPKKYDLRVTVVGSRVFATAIHSQAHEETSTDWRRGTRPDVPHEAITLPSDVEAACVAVTAGLGLDFGAVDLVCDPEGRHWFLEINPNGQWAWIQNRTGAPIAAAIVDELQRRAAA